MNTSWCTRTRAVVLTALTGALTVLAISVAPGASADPSDTSSAADVYPAPTPCATTVLDGTFQPDATLKIESTGFAPNSAAQIWLHSDPVLLLNTTSDANGTITATVHIPADLAPGAHKLEITMPNRTCTLTLHNGSSGVAASATSRPQPGPTQPTLGVEATTTTNSSSLAFTGASTLTSLVIVVVLLAGGTFLLVLGRRRRT